MGRQQTPDTGGKVLSAETAGGRYRVGGVGTAVAAGCWGTVARAPKRREKAEINVKKIQKRERLL